MKRYLEFKPTQFDHHYRVDGREDWFLAPVSRNRDSDILDQSNFAALHARLGVENEDNYEIHRFNYWGPGWFEIILINPANRELVKIAEDAESDLANYPILDDQDFSEHETDAANQIWRDCYTWRERIKYMRKNRLQFDGDLNDLLACARGEYFSGYASELIG